MMIEPREWDVCLALDYANKQGKRELAEELNKLRLSIQSLPALKESGRDLSQMEVWDQVHHWIGQLYSIALRYRDIGHIWKLNAKQKSNLQQYHDANALLLRCIDSHCYLSREVRQEIEDTLLLPIAEIERYKAEHS